MGPPIPNPQSSINPDKCRFSLHPNNILSSSGPFQPFRRLVFKGLIAECDAGRFTATAPDAVIGFHIDGTLSILYGAHGADPECVTILAVMLADNVQHLYLLSKANSE
jgi:hypothetical protein